MDDKTMDEKARRAQKIKKNLGLIGVSALAVLAMIGGIFAFAYSAVGGLDNDFDRTYVTSQVNVSGDIVNVTNTSDADAYIRAAILVTWKNSDGKSGWSLPQEDVDYKLTVDANTNWNSDCAWYMDSSTEFYYYKSTVAPQEITRDLISKIERLGTPPSGYELSVEVVTQAIAPKDTATEEGDIAQAMAEAWSITIYG